ncbi:hypothetical protein HY477_03285 [Candidatus Uhrbacteria bacterium]|nr:hypothetical protein [Candidatus Uhrbacteria bacterium]
MAQVKLTDEGQQIKEELEKIQGCVAEAMAALERGKLEQARKIVAEGLTAVSPRSLVGIESPGETAPAKVPEGSRIIEGVFDGQHMVGADGRQYLVPPNYASKSKLVEGDMLKLAITPQGAFVYKQIGPIERKRVSTIVEQDEHGFLFATDGMHKWRLLTAAVTYFKGKAGDEVIILIPSGAPSKWAAVENIIAK